MKRYRDKTKRTGAICVAIILSLLTIPIAANAELHFNNGMVQWLSDIDQNTFRSCTGNLYGLEDQDGRIILPTKYSDIEYCGHGIFLATEVQSRNKYYFGDNRHFFNRDGVELNFALPDNAFLFNIFSFGDKADQNPSLVLHKLPSGTMLHFGYQDEPGQFHHHSRQGLCDLQGNVLMPPIRATILFLEPSKALIIHDGGRRSILDLKTWTEVPTELFHNPGSVPRPRIPWPSNYQVQMPFPKDRIRKEVTTDDGKFDHDYWCEKRDYPIKGIDMFNRLLHEYDLIGMPRNQVVALLGEARRPPKWAECAGALAYSFPHIGCTPWFFGIKINLQDDHVTSWSFIEGDPTNDKGKESELIKTNVVLIRCMSNGRLISARIGEPVGGRPFPEIEPKKLHPNNN